MLVPALLESTSKYDDCALAVVPSPCGAHAESISSCNSTVAPSPNGARTETGSSCDSTSGYLKPSSCMPLGPELNEQLIGPLGVLGNTWVLPPWSEKHRHLLPENAQDVAFAWNSEDDSNPDAFVPLCYTGSFGMVQFFWPRVGNTLGLLPGMVVAVKYQDLPLKDQKGVDREVELLRECASPNIVPLYSFSRHEKESWMVMPFVGYNLRTALMQDISDLDASVVFLNLVQGVKSMHDRGVLHRDLKPENVLVARGANGDVMSVFLADFGHACGGRSQWPRNNFATTLEYSAPEIWEQGLSPAAQRDKVQQKSACSLADTYSEATDIWAISVMLLQLVLRTVYVPGVLEESSISPFVMYLGVLSLANRVDDLIEAARCLPAPVKAILRTGLQKDPDQRLGPDRAGINYILGLAKEWNALSNLNAASQHQPDRANVMELFKSATNEVVFQQNFSGLTPSAFEPPAPKTPKGLGSSIKCAFKSGAELMLKHSPTARPAAAAPLVPTLSPGSMV